jgi:Uma2 family endonuclease
MNTPEVQIPTDTWISATWEEYLQAIDNPVYAKAKGYYYDHNMRIEMAPLGHDHAADNTIASFAVNLFCGFRAIPTKGLTNCTFRKQGFEDAQPDLAYYVGDNADAIPWGTSIIDLNTYPSPDLVIEVANTSLAEDQGAKRLLYEDLGVKEYWVLDVKNVRVLAFEIENQGSHRITESKVLPGLQIALLQEALQRTRQTNQSQVVAWLIAEFQRS